MSHLPPWSIKREIVIRTDVDPNTALGHWPHNRPISLYIRFGIVNLDKPAGPSSHEVVAWVKLMLGLEHAGHGGTLDA